MLELLHRHVGGRLATVVATERSDGDMHPERVPPEILVARQMMSTGRRWFMLDEVHGTDVHRCDESEPTVPIAGVGDVLVGATPGRAATGAAIAIWAADCAPIVLFDDRGVPVGCHAGWRGLAAGVIDVTLDLLGAPRAAVLGPCIHPCCYEFGDGELVEVARGVGVEPAAIAATTSTGALALDVPAAVAASLHRRGVELDVVGPCVGCDDRWFSHRRGDLGRHAVVAWSDPAP
jgi:polyphenol oxidase